MVDAEICINSAVHVRAFTTILISRFGSDMKWESIPRGFSNIDCPSMHLTKPFDWALVRPLPHFSSVGERSNPSFEAPFFPVARDRMVRPIDVEDLWVKLMSLSGHKSRGSMEIGA
jgi:hypothetical protein